MITQVPHYPKNGDPLGQGLYATNTRLRWVISSAAWGHSPANRQVPEAERAGIAFSASIKVGVWSWMQRTAAQDPLSHSRLKSKKSLNDDVKRGPFTESGPSVILLISSPQPPSAQPRWLSWPLLNNSPNKQVSMLWLAIIAQTSPNFLIKYTLILAVLSRKKEQKQRRETEESFPAWSCLVLTNWASHCTQKAGRRQAIADTTSLLSLWKEAVLLCGQKILQCWAVPLDTPLPRFGLRERNRISPHIARIFAGGLCTGWSNGLMIPSKNAPFLVHIWYFPFQRKHS